MVILRKDFIYYFRFKNFSQSNKLYEKEGAAIWYMQKCVKGREESAVRDWKAQHPSERKEAFFFTYDRLKRYEGGWHLLKVPLFPGIIFLEFEKEISQKKSGLILDQDSGAIRVDYRTEEFLRELGGEAHHVSMSRGVIRNGVTIVTEGPLEGKEAKIQKIDRHKRLAKIGGGLNVPFCQEGGFWAGLEITSKSEGV